MQIEAYPPDFIVACKSVASETKKKMIKITNSEFKRRKEVCHVMSTDDKFIVSYFHISSNVTT